MAPHLAGILIVLHLSDSALMSQTGDPGTSQTDMAPALGASIPAGETENSEVSKQNPDGL